MSTPLTQQIINLSESTVWEAAKMEWSLHEIDFADEYETCLCGHYPIREICILKNMKNGKHVTVGNCCVKKFIGLPSDKIFRSIKKIKADPLANINGDLLAYAFEQHWINDWEHNFYAQNLGKRKFSDRQLLIKQQINNKILGKLGKKK